MFWRIATFAAVGGLAGVLGYWVADREVPVVVNDMAMLTPVVAPGGELRVKVWGIRKRSCRSVFQRLYRDGQGARFAPDDIDVRLSTTNFGPDEWVVPVPVSVTAAPGNATFRMLTVYYCNPFHYAFPIIDMQPPISFRIEGPPEREVIETVPRR